MASAIVPRLTVRIDPEVAKTYPNVNVAFLLARVDFQKAAAKHKEFSGTLKDRDITPISGFFEACSNISANNTTSMGAFDLSKVEGDIELRYGREGEPSVPREIVYADSKDILTWLWNNGETAHCPLPPEKSNAPILLIAEQIETSAADAATAIAEAIVQLLDMNGQFLCADLLDASHPEANYDLSRLAEGVAAPLFEGSAE